MCEALLSIAGRSGQIRFEQGTHPALHPGRSAQILKGSDRIGWIGEIHPAVARDLEMPRAILFEIQVHAVTEVPRTAYHPVSKFPSVRRDVAVVVSRDVPAAALVDAIRRVSPDHH